MSAINILQHLFSSYGTIDEIDLEENAVKMMGPYDPIEPLAQLIEQLKNGREFPRSGGEIIADTMMASKWIPLLALMGIFNKDIMECQRQGINQKT